tara:strand:- start:43 stop:1284 length:1242 start_codon:yes stop_codon:yes gene_type:complete
MGWSKKYKKSIDCNNPKGFSQKAHCQGRKKREHMEINELVPNMQVVNPQAYNQLLKKQLTKTKKVGTALKNKKDPLHKKALQLIKRFIKKEMLNPPNYLRNVGNVPQNNPDGEHRFKKGKDQEESIMKSDKVENMIRNLIRTEIKKIRESQMMTEEQFDEKAGKKDACYHKVKARYDVWPSAYASGALVKCRKVGAKNWGNKSKKEGYPGKSLKPLHDDEIDEKKEKMFPSKLVDLGVRIARAMSGNMTGAVQKIEKIRKGLSQNGRVKYALRQANEGFASDAQRRAAFASGYEEKGKKKKKKESVEESYDIWMEDGSWGYTMTGLLPEAEYQGRKVKLGKPMQGDVKKFKVYVKNPKGNVIKVNFGQGGDAKGGTMRIRKSNPKARANFRARHNCDNPGPRHKARYWSCRKW